jgi:hypothetical protein
MHYECELAVVIGKTAKRVKRDDAYDFMAGYTVANDYAIRDYLENWYRPNLRVKNRDTCTPLGPWLVDAADMCQPDGAGAADHGERQAHAKRQHPDMIFDVPFLIEYFSSFMTLQPGDLILTGTPDGVVDCQPGDVIVTTIEGVGDLINTISEYGPPCKSTTSSTARPSPARLFRNRQPRHAGRAGRSGRRRRSRSQCRRRRRQGSLPQMGRHARAAARQAHPQAG